MVVDPGAGLRGRERRPGSAASRDLDELDTGSARHRRRYQDVGHPPGYGGPREHRRAAEQRLHRGHAQAPGTQPQDAGVGIGGPVGPDRVRVVAERLGRRPEQLPRVLAQMRSVILPAMMVMVSLKVPQVTRYM